MKKKEMVTKSQMVFANEEEFQRVYEKCLDNAPKAPDTIGESYDKIGDSIEAYILAVEEYTFRYAYEFGYAAGLEAVSGKSSSVA